MCLFGGRWHGVDMLVHQCEKLVVLVVEGLFGCCFGEALVVFVIEEVFFHDSLDAVFPGGGEGTQVFVSVASHNVRSLLQRSE